MSYANCSPVSVPTTSAVPGTWPDVSDEVRHRLKIAYISPSLQILDYVRSLKDADSQTLNGLLRHFSDYAVAW
jgi:hypothetical protein